jgi:DnaD/phage-associated family protein
MEWAMVQDWSNFISASDVDVLLRAHDGDCALLCLWCARTGSRDLERAARDLCMTRSQVDAAAEKLGRMLPAFFRSSPGTESAEDPEKPSSDPSGRKRNPVLPPADELPEYTSEEIASCSEKDGSFRAVLDLAETLLGKGLTKHDMSRLLGIYNHLGLSAEVIFVLLHYCAEISKGPSGADRKPTVNFIERQAYVWVNRGITSAELAEEYVERQRSAREDENRIKRILEIYDRNLTPTEKNNIAAWVEMGFADDAIALAYERTLDKTGKRSFPYMNSILMRWHEAKLHTAAEITRKEPGGRSVNHPGRGTGKHPFVPTEF